MTSTPPAMRVPVPTTDPSAPVSAADRFLALVEQTRAAVEDALAADAAARPRRDDAGHTRSSEDADDAAGAEDTAVPPTQLEQLVSGLLGGHDVAWVPVRIVG
ncbi:hypothetical protein [Blastococcus montanus]|uniref:hypothetical protein n=1 Tax=Blastococcus montanus TaxID=3144973 RepID=UPI00320A6928